MKEKTSLGSKILSLCFAVLSVFWLIPVFLTLINSFKSNNFVNLEAFASILPEVSSTSTTSSSLDRVLSGHSDASPFCSI